MKGQQKGQKAAGAQKAGAATQQKKSQGAEGEEAAGARRAVDTQGLKKQQGKLGEAKQQPAGKRKAAPEAAAVAKRTRSAAA